METYRILVLGASGSGKTFFLASMYKRLAVQDKGIGFSVEAPSDQRKNLIQRYTEIANPDLDWPPGTLRDEVSNWEFTCVVKTLKGKSFPLFKFNYLDYSGETLTQSLAASESLTPKQEIEKEAKGADALLVLLDGHKVLNLLDGKRYAHARLDSDLSNILPVVQSIEDVPIHFVLTKWDLLQNQYSLGEIKLKLMNEFDHFSSIVEQRKQLAMPTRLIPISSLGVDFVTLDSEGIMRKNPTGAPKPFQVEMPISCLLIDKFQVAQARNRSELIDLKLSLRTLFIQTSLVAVNVLKFVPIPGGPVFGIMFELFGHGIEKSEEKLKQKQKEALEAIGDEASAIKSVIISQNRLLARLETQYPDSILS